ncbi:MAG TPA: hypothetical protein VFD30_09045 [Terriglobia bacterium]|nr:hypothetical protein [Terriglobia bacterium]
MSENIDITSKEWLVLRTLCLAPAQGSVRETARRRLKQYRWREPLHRTLFTVLSDLSTDDPETIRNLLPSRLTRYGYPDTDFATLFVAHSLSKEEAELVIEQLASSR